MKGRILITARAFWEHGAQAEAVLRENGFEVTRTPNPGPLPEATLLPLLPGYDAVIASSDGYTAALFAACPQLKIVSRWGVGIDSVDLNAATQNGVVITNCPGSMTEPVADYTFALLLGISRKIVEGDALVRAGKWGELTGVLVCGKTLGLVGLGQIGQGVARRAAGFGMRILAYDPPMQQAGKDALPPGLPAVEFVSLDELLAQSDFVSIHAPNLPETKQMFNAGSVCPHEADGVSHQYGAGSLDRRGRSPVRAANPSDRGRGSGCLLAGTAAARPSSAAGPELHSDAAQRVQCD